MMTPRDVIYVSRDGTIDTARYDREAGAALLNADSSSDEVYAIQMVAGRYEIYELSEIGWENTRWFKGPPKFVTDDYDAAITWAVLMCGRAA